MDRLFAETKGKSFVGKLKDNIAAPLQVVAVLLLAYVITVFLPSGIRSKMGVMPRSIDGLLGIVFHPFLHFGLRHLLCNVLAIVVFGWLISLRSRNAFLAVTVAAWLAGGVLLWIVGRPQTLVGGASGIVYGYLGFILLRGVFDKRPVSIVLSILTLYFFHGALVGLLPTQIHVSWRGHLCGFAVGVLCAYLSRHTTQRRRWPSETDDT